MKSKTFFLTLFMISFLISCNQKKEDSNQENISSNSEIDSKDQKETEPTNPKKAIYFTIGNKKYGSETFDTAGIDAMESNEGGFSIILGFSETNNDDNWGAFSVKISDDLLTDGIKKVKNAVVTFNYSEEGSLPMVYSCSSDDFRFEITQVDMVKSESTGGVTINDYKFSGVFSGYMKGVDATGSIKNIEVKGGKFENLSFSQIKNN